MKKMTDKRCVSVRAYKCSILYLVTYLVLHAQEMRNFLPLPLHEKKNCSDRMMAEQRKELFRQLKEEEEEEREKDTVKTLRQAKRKPTLQIQTPARHELKTALLKQSKWKPIRNDNFTTSSQLTFEFIYLRVLFIPSKHSERM